MLIGADVVGEKNINPVQPKSLQTVLVAAHDAIITVVVDHMERQRITHAVVTWIVHRPWRQQPANFV